MTSTRETSSGGAPAEASDWTGELADIAALAGRIGGADELLERALDSLEALIPYDLAAVLELRNDELTVRCARGRLVDERVRAHRIRLADFPSVRRAIELREPRVLLEDDHAHGEGDPYDGVLDLPHGHSCMVVPLFAGDRSLGAITFDRTECYPYPNETLRLARVYGQIVALGLVAAEQAARLDRYRRRLQEEKRLLLEEHGGPSEAGRMLEHSRSPEMRRITQLAKQVAITDAPVLIRGETGTGKEVLAAAIHDWSRRRHGPFVKINCAALPENLIETELFGHTKGAFSGATKPRPGRFAVADGGTLLLDEIGELSPALQAKLLRVLQEGTYEQVGSDKPVRVDVRIMAATHVDLEDAMSAGSFREDLFYRLNVFPIELPALRARREDIGAIAREFLTRLAARRGGGPWSIGPEALAALEQRDWPGNVRELLNVLERATILCPEGELAFDSPATAGARPARRAEASAPKGEASDDAIPMITLDELQAQHIRRVVDHCGGRIYGERGAAKILGLKPSTLQSRMKKLGVPRVVEG